MKNHIFNNIENEYREIMGEIRDRVVESKQILEYKLKDKDTVENVALKLRKSIELIAYLSVLLNKDTLNHKIKNDFRADKIIDGLNVKTTIFYPVPCLFTFMDNNEPLVIPTGYKESLSLMDMKNSYNNLGKLLHANHPIKKDTVDNDLALNFLFKLVRYIEALLDTHIIPVKRTHSEKIYDMIHAEIVFTVNAPIIVTTFRELIYNEDKLIELFKNGLDIEQIKRFEKK